MKRNKSVIGCLVLGMLSRIGFKFKHTESYWEGVIERSIKEKKDVKQKLNEIKATRDISLRKLNRLQEMLDNLNAQLILLNKLSSTSEKEENIVDNMKSYYAQIVNIQKKIAPIKEEYNSYNTVYTTYNEFFLKVCNKLDSIISNAEKNITNIKINKTVKELDVSMDINLVLDKGIGENIEIDTIVKTESIKDKMNDSDDLVDINSIYIENIDMETYIKMLNTKEVK